MDNQIDLESEILSAIMKHVRTRYYCWHIVADFTIVRTSSNAQGAFIVFHIDNGMLICETYCSWRTRVIAAYEIASPKFDVLATANFIIAKLREMQVMHR